MDNSVKLVVFIYIGFFLGFLALDLLINLVLKIGDRFERAEKKRAKIAH